MSSSNGLALLARREETLIALMQFLMLPLSFLSVTFMQEDLMPGWMRTAAGFNPVNWAVEAGRAALASSPDCLTDALKRRKDVEVVRLSAGNRDDLPERLAERLGALSR